ncbi:MAG TPA: aminotransferase class V-fold PLP-dependent enzyme [Polyangiaceae bacterium]|nr:aminotransferase class V-fold PLP-dependent enzyme [Polyangiaceae bacterium]
MHRALDRRRFLGVSLAAGALGSAACQGTTHVSGAVPVASASDEWSLIRDLFPLARDRIHMTGLLLASHPSPVRDAIERHRRGLDEDPVNYLEENGGRLEQEARVAAARYVGGDPDEIALTDSTTMGLGLLYTALDLRPGDEILTTEHDHYSTKTSLDNAAARTGATLKRIALYTRSETASEEEIVGAVSAAVTPRTRVIALTWVHSGTGVRIPIAHIAAAVARLNAERDEKARALLCVDGVHGFGSTENAVSELGCDFFVAGCHKWIFGPRGTGIVWGRARAWPAVRPTIPPFDMVPGKVPGRDRRAPPVLARRITPGGFHSFEHRWALAEAFALHERIGRERVASRIHALNRQLKEGLAGMQNVKVYTPRADALSAGLTCFDVAGLAPDAVVARLAQKRIIASQTPYETSYARLTPGLLNSPEEVDAALRAVRELT